MRNDDEIQEKFIRIASHLDEKSKRLWCANEAISLGWGGVTQVSKATGVSRSTMTDGIKELIEQQEMKKVGIRKKGGGRKKKQLQMPIFGVIWKIWSIP